MSNSKMQPNYNSIEAQKILAEKEKKWLKYIDEFLHITYETYTADMVAKLRSHLSEWVTYDNLFPVELEITKHERMIFMKNNKEKILRVLDKLTVELDYKYEPEEVTRQKIVEQISLTPEEEIAYGKQKEKEEKEANIDRILAEEHQRRVDSTPIINKVPEVATPIQGTTNNKPVILSVLKSSILDTYYDPYDNSFFFNDFLNKYNKHTFPKEEIDTWQLTLVNDLKRVLRIVTSTSKFFTTFIKTDEDKKFDMLDRNVHLKFYASAYECNVPVYIRNRKTGKKELTYAKRHVLFPAYNSEFIDHFTDRSIEWRAYHKGEYFKRPKYFNIFPGFKANRIEDFDEKYEEYYKEINFILEHIKICWCNNDVKKYKWILTWFATPIRFDGQRTQKVPIIKGPQGCGKSWVFELLTKFIYGSPLGESSAGLDHILGRFNDSLKDTMLYACDEVETSSHEALMGFLQKFKFYITQPKMRAEAKFKDSISIDNNVNYSVCSNNYNPIQLEPGQRRFLPFECINRFNTPIEKAVFRAKIKAISKQRTGDLLYSFFLSDHFETLLVDLEEMPFDEAYRRLEVHSRKPTVAFYHDHFDDNEATQDLSLNVNFCFMVDPTDNVKKAYIPVHCMYELFVDWSREERGQNISGNKANPKFSGELNDYARNFDPLAISYDPTIRTCSFLVSVKNKKCGKTTGFWWYGLERRLERQQQEQQLQQLQQQQKQIQQHIEQQQNLQQYLIQEQQKEQQEQKQ